MKALTALLVSAGLAAGLRCEEGRIREDAKQVQCVDGSCCRSVVGASSFRSCGPCLFRESSEDGGNWTCCRNFAQRRPAGVSVSVCECRTELCNAAAPPNATHDCPAERRSEPHHIVAFD